MTFFTFGFTSRRDTLHTRYQNMTYFSRQHNACNKAKLNHVNMYVQDDILSFVYFLAFNFIRYIKCMFNLTFLVYHIEFILDHG